MQPHMAGETSAITKLAESVTTRLANFVATMICFRLHEIFSIRKYENQSLSAKWRVMEVWEWVFLHKDQKSSLSEN